MRHLLRAYILSLALYFAVLARSAPQQAAAEPAREVSAQLFGELEELSRLVAISYCVGFQGIQKPFKCLSHCDEFPELELVQTWDTGLITNSCGYIALSHPPTYPSRILVVFRGTGSFSNLLSDLQTSHAEYVPYPVSGGRKCANCTVHGGFMSAWNATRSAIWPQLQILRADFPNHEIVLTGHSLGGAVAGLAGLQLMTDPVADWGKIKVVTFGEPMFGNKGMARFVDEMFGCNGTNVTAGDEKCAYRRVTHAGDPVPLLPPAEWGWRQHGGEVFISKPDLPPERKDLRLCQGPQDSTCLDNSSEKNVETAITILKRRGFPVDHAEEQTSSDIEAESLLTGIPTRWQIWQLLFAHREYVWRLGLCFDPGWPWDKSPGLADSDEL